MLISLVVIILQVSSVVSASENKLHIKNPEQEYTYEMMTSDIKTLAEKYPEIIDYHSLGQTPYGREIWAIKLGHGDATLFINGSHHAREWITTNLNMRMIDQYAKAYSSNQKIDSYNVRQLLNDVTIWFVPMVNPDGVTLQQKGVAALPEEVHEQLLKMNEGSTDFTRWKANANGVDLNRNYDVQWESVHNNVSHPNWQLHKGSKPFSEVETQLIRGLTREINPEMAIAYHTSGELLYWHYNEASYQFIRDKVFADVMGQMTGYEIIRPEGLPSGGTYTDWFIQEYKRPAFTLELNEYIEDRHVPVENFPRIWEENRLVPLYAARQSYELWFERQNVKPVNQAGYLTSVTPLHRTPQGNDTPLRLSPQSVSVAGIKGDWVKVMTFAGDMWIHNRFIKWTPKQEVSETITLNHRTAMYQAPTYYEPAKSYLAPQNVQALAQWDDWYLINTWLGEYWVNPSDNQNMSGE